MILKALKYKRNENTDNEWTIIGNHDDYVHFSNINLLVGKNSAGKTRMLEVIHEISNLLSGNKTILQSIYPSQKFDLIFWNNHQEYRYLLEFSNAKIHEEILYIDQKEYYNRKEQSANNELIQKLFNKISDSELLINSACNLSINIIDWAKSLKYYPFINHAEKNKLVKDYNNNDISNKLNPEDSILEILHKGIHYFKEFTSEIQFDMAGIGYRITSLGIKKIDTGYSIFVEEDHRFIVGQTEMSQGMFRSLSLFILLAYAKRSQQTLCVLIDDLGEGVDYYRSKKMIDIVIHKVNKSNIQLITTSNDRYVMNHVPLKFWLVIDRLGSNSIFYDYINSTSNYEDFKYTGLNNFDFLTTDFYSKGFGDGNGDID